MSPCSMPDECQAQMFYHPARLEGTSFQVLNPPLNAGRSP
jgi:hypothetical protein